MIVTVRQLDSIMADDETKLGVYSAMSRFHDSKDLSDFTITSNGSTWYVHRLLLCMHSDVFAEWCMGSFQEVKEGQVDLSDHDPQHLDELIKYLYTFDYDVAEDANKSEELCFHVRMCMIADKYNIQGLKTLSTRYFQYEIDPGVGPNELAPACALAYEASTATTAIRKALLSEIVASHESFFPDESTPQSKELEDVISAYPEFALDIVKAFTKSTNYEERKWAEYQCPHCAGSFQAPYSTRANVVYACRFCNFIMAGALWQDHIRPGE